MSGLSAFAPAKINLYLHVVGRRDDGYHLLDSLVVFPDVGDRLTVEPASGLALSITGPFVGGLAAETNNLVQKAAQALAAHAGIEPTGRLMLEKHLPVSSGIGGGSADAAAALRLLCRFWGISPADDAMHDIARRLGADVPVCLASRPAVMSGIGEHLVAAPPLPDIGLVLVNPGVAVSTPSVFRSRSGAFSAIAPLPANGWNNAMALAETLHGTANDLQAAATVLAPPISQALTALTELPGCLLARMSGSGATCFGLFATPDKAGRAVGLLARSGWWVWGGGLLPQRF
jgi:4-diphosphocytidyl-2-C-methyl-D-erythritol kinase